MPLKPYDDPSHAGNAPTHHTGKPCIEPGCAQPAGTAWGPLWCQACNAQRIRRISGSLSQLNRPNGSTGLAAAVAKLKKAGWSARMHQPDGVQGQARRKGSESS